jgi:inner membrane protein
LNKFEKALNKQGIHYSDYCKTHSFQYHLWNANVATTASYLLADYSLDSQPITFTTYNKNKALESQLNGNSDFEN